MTTDSMTEHNDSMMDGMDTELVDPATMTPEELVDAARWGELELVQAMAEQGLVERIAMAADERGNGMLHMATANGHLQICQLLLQVHPGLVNQKNKEGNTPLHWAAMTGQVEIIRVLVGAGADLLARNRMGRDALFEAEMALKEDAAALLNSLIDAQQGNGEMAAEGENLPEAGMEEEDCEMEMQ